MNILDRIAKLRALDAAGTRLVDLEERSEQDLRKKYKDLAAHRILEGPIEADDSSQSASDSRAGQQSRNQSLRPRVQDPQT